MRSALRRRPSAGLVLGAAGLLVATAALVVGLAGTATGLPGKYRIDRNDLRPRVVKPFNIQRNAVRAYQLAPRGIRAWHVSRDAIRPFHIRPNYVPRADAMWAFVADDGSLVRSSHPGIGSTRRDTGEYAVGFPRSVADCAYVATNAAPDNTPVDADEIGVNLDAPVGTDNRVFVNTENSDSLDVDDEFMLAVLC